MTEGPANNTACSNESGVCPPDAGRSWTFGRVADLIVRLVPAAAVLSMLFVLEGGLRWLGLLGIPLIILAFHRGCPSCSVRRADGGTSAWRPFAGH